MHEDVTSVSAFIDKMHCVVIINSLKDVCDEEEWMEDENRW